MSEYWSMSVMIIPPKMIFTFKFEEVSSISYLAN